MVHIRNLSCQNDVVISELDVRASSRVGIFDFGGNAGHIQSLVEQVKKELRGKLARNDAQMHNPVTESAEVIPEAEVLQPTGQAEGGSSK